MKQNPFDGCWHRIERARNHRRTAAAEWNGFLDHDPFDFNVNVDHEGNCSLWIEQVAPVPPLLGILFGEYVYNLRAALDYCAYAVAMCDSEQDPPPGEAVLQFPIYADGDSYRRNEFRIASIAEKHRGWLESLQPYRGDFGPEGTALYWINELARKDRHRHLQVVGAYVAESYPMVRSSRPADVFFEDVDPYVFVEGDTEIARCRIVPFVRGDVIEANPQTGLDVEILEMAKHRPLDCKWLFLPLDQRLRLIEALVESFIVRFERDCTGVARSPSLAPEADVGETSS